MRLTVILLGVLLLAITSALAYSVRPQPETVRAEDSMVRTLPTSPPLVPELGDVAALGRAQTTTTVPVESSWHGHPCGIDLPPCYVLRRESGGDINAYNPSGCGGRGCRGKWQCSPETCSGRGTEAQQDAEARRVWDHGKGCANWAAC